MTTDGKFIIVFCVFVVVLGAVNLLVARRRK